MVETMAVASSASHTDFVAPNCSKYANSSAHLSSPSITRGLVLSMHRTSSTDSNRFYQSQEKKQFYLFTYKQSWLMAMEGYD